MQMTNCFHYGQDCSDCDDSEGIPACFKSRYEQCGRCGDTIDIDVGCIRCDQDPDYGVIDQENQNDGESGSQDYAIDAKDGDGRYYEQIDRALI